MGFPAGAICSGQQVRDRADASMTKDQSKSGDSCLPPSPPAPPPALLHAPGLLPRLDSKKKKKDHLKETRCARISLAAPTPITSSRLSSLTQSPPFSTDTERERESEVTSPPAWLSVRSRVRLLRASSTRRADSGSLGRTGDKRTGRERADGTGPPAAAGGAGRSAKHGAERHRDADRILMPTTRTRVSARLHASPLARTTTSLLTSVNLMDASHASISGKLPELSENKIILMRGGLRHLG